MSGIQYIRTRAGKDLAVLPRADYERLAGAARCAGEANGDMQRARHKAAWMRRRDQDADDGLPRAVAERMRIGMHPVRAWREHRGLTAGAVAERAGISQGYLMQIEGGSRTGTFSITAALARALRVNLDDLTACAD